MLPESGRPLAMGRESARIPALYHGAVLDEPGLQGCRPLSFPLHVILEYVDWRPEGLTVDRHSQQKLEVRVHHLVVDVGADGVTMRVHICIA